MERLDVFAFSKLQSFLMALVGLVFGIIYSFGGLAVDTLVTLELISTSETPGLSFGTLLAFGALIGMPLIFAAAGFILGILEAVLYNLFAKWFPGFKPGFYIKSFHSD